MTLRLEYSFDVIVKGAQSATALLSEVTGREHTLQFARIMARDRLRSRRQGRSPTLTPFQQVFLGPSSTHVYIALFTCPVLPILT